MATSEELRRSLQNRRASLRKWLLVAAIFTAIPIFLRVALLLFPIPGGTTGVPFYEMPIRDLLVLSTRAFLFLGGFIVPHALAILLALRVIVGAYPVLDIAYGRRKTWQIHYLALGSFLIVLALSFDIFILMLRLNSRN